jgi:hypothetical protein
MNGRGRGTESGAPGTEAAYPGRVGWSSLPSPSPGASNDKEEPMMSVVPAEPRRFEPVSDELILAAVERAQRHRER